MSPACAARSKLNHCSFLFEYSRRRGRKPDSAEDGGGAGEDKTRLAGRDGLGHAKRRGRSGQRRAGANERLPERWGRAAPLRRGLSNFL